MADAAGAVDGRNVGHCDVWTMLRLYTPKREGNRRANMHAAVPRVYDVITPLLDTVHAIAPAPRSSDPGNFLARSRHLFAPSTTE
jgi:hypothetical protein